MNINKIFEIISTDIQRSYYNRPFKNPTNVMPSTASPQHGDSRYDKGVRAGSFSQVKPNPNDPHTVTKRSKRPTHSRNIGRKDIFGDFVKYLNDSDLFGNTYFPKVYNFKTIEDSEGKEVYKYNIEKLNEMDTLNRKQVEYLVEKIFGELPDDVKQKIVEEGDGSALSHTINEIAGDYVNYNMKSRVNIVSDEEFIEALDIIAKFLRIINQASDGDALFDRSVGNIMYRNTPYGPQVVFADPVFDRGLF